MKYRVPDNVAETLLRAGWTLVPEEMTAFTDRLETYQKIDVLFQSGEIAKNCIPNTDISDHRFLIARNWANTGLVAGNTIIAWKLSVK